MNDTCMLHFYINNSYFGHLVTKTEINVLKTVQYWTPGEQYNKARTGRKRRKLHCQPQSD